MKTIVKSEAPVCLQEARAKGWDWNTFVDNAHEEYLTARAWALGEQGNECAYTGLWLGKGTKQTVHLDHFHKKAIYAEETFSWENLFAAAKNLDYGSDYKDKQIHGPRMNADAQYQSFWSPLQAGLVNAFWYRQDGWMEPGEHLSAEDRRLAQQTIDMYNLNSPDLKRKRRDIIRCLGNMQQLEEDEVRSAMETMGFSFLIDFELKQRE